MARYGSESVKAALKILGFSAADDVTSEKLKEQYIKTIQRVHPDKGGNEYLSQQVNDARDVLEAWMRDGKPFFKSSSYEHRSNTKPDSEPAQGKKTSKDDRKKQPFNWGAAVTFVAIILVVNHMNYIKEPVRNTGSQYPKIIAVQTSVPSVAPVPPTIAQHVANINQVPAMDEKQKDNLIGSCIQLATHAYSLPPAVLIGIYRVEGGKIGGELQGQNNHKLLGPMAINDYLIPELSRGWNVSDDTAAKWVRDDPCTNIGIAAWILSTNLYLSAELGKAIVLYGEEEGRDGEAFKNNVYKEMNR